MNMVPKHLLLAFISGIFAALASMFSKLTLSDHIQQILCSTNNDVEALWIKSIGISNCLSVSFSFTFFQTFGSLMTSWLFIYLILCQKNILFMLFCCWVIILYNFIWTFETSNWYKNNVVYFLSKSFSLNTSCRFDVFWTFWTSN